MRRDRWIQAGLAALRRQAPGAAAAEIDEAWPAAAESGPGRASRPTPCGRFLELLRRSPGGRDGPRRIDPPADRRQARPGGRAAAVAGPAVARPRGGRPRRGPVGRAVRSRPGTTKGRPLATGNSSGSLPTSCAATARPANNWPRRCPRTDRSARCSSRRRPGRRAWWTSPPKRHLNQTSWRRLWAFCPCNTERPRPFYAGSDAPLRSEPLGAARFTTASAASCNDWQSPLTDRGQPDHDDGITPT